MNKIVKTVTCRLLYETGWKNAKWTNRSFCAMASTVSCLVQFALHVQDSVGDQIFCILFLFIHLPVRIKEGGDEDYTGTYLYW